MKSNQFNATVRYGTLYLFFLAFLPFALKGQQNVIINMAPIDGVAITPDNIFDYQIQSFGAGKVQVTGHLLKAICILNHPVASTDNSDSLQLIIPQSQVGRRHGTESVFFNMSWNYTDFS